MFCVDTYPQNVLFKFRDSTTTCSKVSTTALSFLQVGILQLQPLINKYLVVKICWFFVFKYTTHRQKRWKRESDCGLCFTCKMGEARSIYEFKPFQYTELIAKNSKPIVITWGLYKAVADSKNIYVYGDFYKREDDNRETTQLWKFNIATRKWTNYKHTENLPTDLVLKVSVLKNDILMIYGGNGQFVGPHQVSNELYMGHLNSANNLCAGPAVTTGDPPVPRCEQAVVYHGGYLYVVGGGTDSMCDIHRININTSVWELVYACDRNDEYVPQCSWYHKIACDGASIVMFTVFTRISEISIFNMEKKKWTKGNILGDPHVTFNDGYPDDGGSVGDIDHIYHHDTKFKCFYWEHNSYVFYNDIIIWEIDFKTFQWRRICQACIYQHKSTSADACPEVMRAAISPDGSKHYIIDYSDHDTVTTTPDIFVTWLEIPKLSEISWEAVLHYLQVFDEKELIRAGVPQRYVNNM